MTVQKDKIKGIVFVLRHASSSHQKTSREFYLKLTIG